MRSDLDRQMVKQLNRLDRRRRIKYHEHYAEELGSASEETRRSTGRHAHERSRVDYRYAADPR